MPKFKVIKNIKVLDHIIFNEGDEIELVENQPIKAKTPFGELELKFDTIKESLKEIEELKITINPLGNDDEIQDWRLQLDVKTSRRKVREIEKYLRETLERMI